MVIEIYIVVRQVEEVQCSVARLSVGTGINYVVFKASDAGCMISVVYHIV